MALPMKRILLLSCMAYLTVGLGQLVVGSVMEPMVHAYGIGYGDGGQLVMHQFLGGLTGTLCAPWLIRRFGLKSLLTAGFALMALAEFTYVAQPSWAIMLAAAPLAGFGFGCVETTVGSLIISSAGNKANSALSRVEVFFGIGALAIPFASAALIDIGQWRLAFACVGGLAVATLASWLLLWPAALKGSAAGGGPEAGRAAARPPRLSGRVKLTLAACASFFFVYVGFEMSFAHYLPSMLVQTGGVSEAGAALALSVFWGAMTLGRLVAGQLADRFGGAAYLIVSCSVCAGAFILMSLLSESVVATMALSFVAGFAMSGLFAIALVFGTRAAPERTVALTSLLLGCGLLGSAVLPRLVGDFLDRFGAGPTYAIVAALAVLLLATAFVAVAANRSRGRSETAAPRG